MVALDTQRNSDLPLPSALMVDITSAILQLSPQNHKQLSQCTRKLIIKMLNKHDIIGFIKHIRQRLEEKTGFGAIQPTALLTRNRGRKAFSTYAQTPEVYLLTSNTSNFKIKPQMVTGKQCNQARKNPCFQL